jgi:hypothetical protein
MRDERTASLLPRPVRQHVPKGVKVDARAYAPNALIAQGLDPTTRHLRGADSFPSTRCEETPTRL